MHSQKLKDKQILLCLQIIKIQVICQLFFLLAQPFYLSTQNSTCPVWNRKEKFPPVLIFLENPAFLCIMNKVTLSTVMKENEVLT